MARHQYGPDSAILECLEDVVESGHGDRILLGGDVARRSRYISYGGMPGLSYLPARFLPRLVARIGRDAVDSALKVNPLRLLALGVKPADLLTVALPPFTGEDCLYHEPDPPIANRPEVDSRPQVELQGQRLIAIATVDALEHAHPLGQCLLEAGLRCVEITFRTENAPDVLQRMRRKRT